VDRLNAKEPPQLSMEASQDNHRGRPCLRDFTASRVPLSDSISWLVGSVSAKIHSRALEEAWHELFKPSQENEQVLKEAVELSHQEKYELVFLTVFKGISNTSSWERIRRGQTLEDHSRNRMRYNASKTYHELSAAGFCYLHVLRRLYLRESRQ